MSRQSATMAQRTRDARRPALRPALRRARQRGWRRSGQRAGCAWLLVSLMLAASLAQAAGEGGGTESVFRFGPTARGIGLGASMTVLGDDASAAFWNPALLQHAPITQLSFSHNRLGVGSGAATLQYAGIVVPTLGSGGFGVALLRVGLGGIDTYDASSRPTGSIEYSESQLLLGYGAGVRLPFVGGRVDLGVTAKVHRLELGESATSGGLDAGLLFQPPQVPRLTVALAMADLIAPSFRLAEQDDPVARTSRYAAVYRVPAGTGRSLRLAASFERPQYAGSNLGVAAEFALSGGHAARLGLHEGRVGVGFGGRWRAYGLDYAYQSGNDLGASHYFSVTWLLGETIAHRRDLLAQARARELEQATALAVATWMQQRLDLCLQHADSLLVEGDVAGAERAVQQAEGFGASGEPLALRRDEIERTRARAAAEQVDASERAARVAHAAEQVRAALDERDPRRARAELEQLNSLDAAHPLAERYQAELDAQLAAAATDRAAQAQLAQADGDFVAALQGWSQVLELLPGDPAALEELARIRDDLRTARGRAQEATQQLALQRRYTEALTAFADDQPQQALVLCEEILRDAPSHAAAAALADRVRAHLAGRPALTAQQEDDVRRLYLAGLQRFTAGEYAAAVVEWEKILAIDPGNHGALGNIREARSRMQRLDTAEGGGE